MGLITMKDRNPAISKPHLLVSRFPSRLLWCLLSLCSLPCRPCWCLPSFFGFLGSRTRFIACLFNQNVLPLWTVYVISGRTVRQISFSGCLLFRDVCSSMVGNYFLESLGFCRERCILQNQPGLKKWLHDVKISFCEMPVEFRYLFKSEKEDFILVQLGCPLSKCELRN